MKTKKQNGFTIVEVLVAQTIVILAGIALLPFIIEEAEQKILDTVANEMYVIGDAAKVYHTRNGTWPNQANNCAVAQALADMEADGVLAGVTVASNFGTNYAFDCTGGSLFRISVSTGAAADRTKYAQDLQNVLYASTLDAATNTVQMNVPLPGAETALDQVLWRSFDASKPERNRMETAIDMNSQDIGNVNELSWGDTGPGNGQRSRLLSDSSLATYSNIWACSVNAPGCGVIVSDEGGFFDNNDGWITFSSQSGANPLTGAGAGANLGLRLGSGSGYLAGIVPGVLAPLDVQGAGYFGQTLSARGNITAGGFDFILGNTDQVSRGNSGSSRALSKDFDGTNAYLRMNNSGDFPGGVIVDGSQLRVSSGPLVWGNSARLSTDEGGSAELGGSNGVAGTGSPYIDFHYSGLSQDYNVRIQNDANGQISLNALTVATTGDLVVNGFAEVKQSLDVARDVVLQSTGKSLSQAVTDAFIVDPAASASARTISKPTCPAGRTPVIFTSVSGVANGPSAYPIHQIDTYATDNGGSWTVSMNLVTSDTTGTPQAGFGKLMAIVKCD